MPNSRRWAMISRTWCVLPVFLAAHAAGQTVLYGVRSNGDLLHIDPATGAAGVLGRSGVPCNAGAAYVDEYLGRYGHLNAYILIGGGAGAQADQFDGLYPWSGASILSRATTGRPAGYLIHAMAVEVYPGSAIYVILSTEEPTTIDLFAEIDFATGAYTVIGPTGRTDLEGLARSPSGAFYA